MAMVIRLLGGLTLWVAGFSALYGLHGLGCALGWGERWLGPVTWLGAALIACWLALVASGAMLLAMLYRNPGNDPTLRRIVLVGGWAGLAGLAWMGAPVLLPAHCL